MTVVFIAVIAVAVLLMATLCGLALVSDTKLCVQDCVEDGYTICIRGEEAPTPPTDWQQWEYEIDHYMKVISFHHRKNKVK